MYLDLEIRGAREIREEGQLLRDQLRANMPAATERELRLM